MPFYLSGENVDLYVLNDPNGETADMVSVSNGKPYVELSTAYNYQEAVISEDATGPVMSTRSVSCGPVARVVARSKMSLFPCQMLDRLVMMT